MGPNRQVHNEFFGIFRGVGGFFTRPLEWPGTGGPEHTGVMRIMANATISRGALPRTCTRSRRARPSAAAGRALLALRVAPFAIRIVLGTVLVVAVWAAVNWMVQVARKPAEVFFPVSGSLVKPPAETWRQYGLLFAKYSTAVITPELLAALAQVEGSGNPMARTYWRWRLSWNPFEVYRPASSAVGMFQITDGTFAEAKRYCIRDHVVVADGPWYDPRSCWPESSGRASDRRNDDRPRIVSDGWSRTVARRLRARRAPK